MKRIVLFCVGLMLGAQAWAAELIVEQAWIRAAPPGAMMLAGYATLKNSGSTPLQIGAARSAAFADVEIHRTVEEGGVSRMRPAGTLEIPPGGSVALEPGGLHLMLMHPRQDLQPGQTVVIDFLTPDETPLPAVFTVRRSH